MNQVSLLFLLRTHVLEYRHSTDMYMRRRTVISSPLQIWWRRRESNPGPETFPPSFYRHSPFFKTEVSSNGQDPIHGRQFDLASKTTGRVFFGQSRKMALRPRPWTCRGGRGASIRQPVRSCCSQSRILPVFKEASGQPPPATRRSIVRSKPFRPRQNRVY